MTLWWSLLYKTNTRALIDKSNELGFFLGASGGSAASRIKKEIEFPKTGRKRRATMSTPMTVTADRPIKKTGKYNGKQINSVCVENADGDVAVVTINSSSCRWWQSNLLVQNPIPTRYSCYCTIGLQYHLLTGSTVLLPLLLPLSITTTWVCIYVSTLLSNLFLIPLHPMLSCPLELIRVLSQELAAAREELQQLRQENCALRALCSSDPVRAAAVQERSS